MLKLFFKYYVNSFINNRESNIIHKNEKLNKWYVVFVDKQLLLENWKQFLFGLWQSIFLNQYQNIYAYFPYKIFWMANCRNWTNFLIGKHKKLFIWKIKIEIFNFIKSVLFAREFHMDSYYYRWITIIRYLDNYWGTIRYLLWPILSHNKRIVLQASKSLKG